METIINKRGGSRKGSGRKPGKRTNVLFVRITDEAMAIAKEQSNISQFIDELIKGSQKMEVSTAGTKSKENSQEDERQTLIVFPVEDCQQADKAE